MATLIFKVTYLFIYYLGMGRPQVQMGSFGVRGREGALRAFGTHLVA